MLSEECQLRDYTGYEFLLALDPFRVEDDERIVGAAFTIRILLPVLERDQGL